MTSLCRFLVAATTLALVPATGAWSAIPPQGFADLRWRLVGPLRGGWATVVAGVPGQPDSFYFGAADGGVWKTSDAGRTWSPLFTREAVASVGALSLAPSDPAVLYVGTGQVTHRWDAVAGNGVYRSADGGVTWEHRGLAESRHIGRLWVDPRDPDVVLAAALGPLFGPGEERGVFRTEDGGRSWRRVLFVDPGTGAVDLAADPAAPEVVFAACWQVRLHPWMSYFKPNVGPGSGIFKSTDAGRTWVRLTGNGLPAGDLGRIGLGARGARVYATIDAGPASGLYRSDDAGASWQRVNPTADLASQYFSRLFVDPRDPDTVWVMGRSLRRSTDGGRTFTVVRGAPGGDDYHFLWIDPERPERMITGADQGAVVTVNGGASWSSWYNQPTGQFYHVATDGRFPYRIYSGQQDSGSVAVLSRSDYGQLTFRDWHPVGADERDYDVPWPPDPDVVYGSGLGGRLSRWDARTGQVQNVSPWPVSSYGARPTTVRYPSSWLQPLAISPLAPHSIYMGSQVLLRSDDGGATWQAASRDLTGAEPGAQGCEADVALERAKACGYGVISAIAPSPLDKDRVWVGTETGLIHLTLDGGKSWRNVTPRGLPEWSRVAQIDASPTSPYIAWAAVDRHRLDDFRPYVYVTFDEGESWHLTTEGLPGDGYVNVVRQDPVVEKLLYAGTRTGVWVSFNGGLSWQPLQLNLPTTGVNDLTVHGNDLVAATQGRALWVLDDVTPLRHLTAQRAAGPYLVPPAQALRVAPNQNRDTPLPIDEPRLANPPAGAVLDYVLPAAVQGPVVLEIADPSGALVRRFASDEAPARLPFNQYFADAWLERPVALPARPGHNRFVWNLRGPRPRTGDYDVSIAAVPEVGTPVQPQGLMVLPGRYEVRLKAGDETLTRTLDVALDPRVSVSAGELEAQQGFYREVAATLAAIAAAAAKVTEGPERAELDTIAGVLAGLATDVESVDRAPTAAQREVLAVYRERFDTVRSRVTIP